jgi:hypothetical protein
MGSVIPIDRGSDINASIPKTRNVSIVRHNEDVVIGPEGHTVNKAVAPYESSKLYCARDLLYALLTISPSTHKRLGIRRLLDTDPWDQSPQHEPSDHSRPSLVASDEMRSTMA